MLMGPLWLRALTQSPEGKLWNTQLSLPIGVGATCATDTIGGVEFQKLKISLGAAGVDGGLVTSTNPLPVAPQVGATGTHASVVENAAVQTLIAANANRLGWSVYNDSDAPLNIALRAGASATIFAIRLLPRAFTSHRDFGGALYTGIITGIWDSAPGTAGHNSARTMELTA